MTAMIRRATEADVEAISGLIGEIEAYYGGTNTPGDVVQIRRALFGDWPVAKVLLAEHPRDGVLGMASYSLLWPAAGAESSLYLKELFVREAARRQGVAKLLMANLRLAARAEGCSRIEWTADRDNPAALAFYKALGLHPNQGKVFYRAD